jgi:hypothetical protein
MESATVRAEGAQAIELEYLGAIVEELDALLRMTYTAGSGKRAPWKPVRVPRPKPEGAAPTKRREPTPEEMLAILGGGRNGG